MEYRLIWLQELCQPLRIIYTEQINTHAMNNVYYKELESISPWEMYIENDGALKIHTYEEMS